MASRAKSLLSNAALVLASLAFCVLLLELGLRFTGYPRSELRFTCFDPLMGNVYCPNITATIRTHEGDRELRTSSDGRVDREYPLERAPGTTRIALLGDSMVALLYLEPEARLKSIWERALAGRTGRPAEVINFAVQGTGTWEQVQTYHLRARAYRPEVVVLAFFWGNDVWNNSARAARRGANPLEGDYRIRFADRVRVAQRGFARWWWNHSLAYQFLRTGADRVAELRRQASVHGWGRAMEVLREGATVALAGAPAGPVHLKPLSGMPEYDWNSPDWDLTRALIERLDADVRADGARLAVFQIPSIIHHRDKLPRAQLDRFLEERGIANFGLFDLYDSQDEETYLSQFIPGDVHWSREGTATAARHSVDALAAALAKPGTTASPRSTAR